MADGEPAAAAPVEFAGTTYKPLADGKYDAIILGTGLKECILSGLLSVKGKKVLHLDRNAYYGAECASLNLTNLYKKFVKNEEPPKEYFDMLGSNRDYNVDLVPKFIMANGKLVKILVHTDVTRYLDFKLIDGSYVYKGAKEGGWLGGGNAAGIHKVPASEGEALKTGLVGFLQKRSLHSFLKYIAKYEQAKPATHEGMDLAKVTMAAVFEKMGLEPETRDFVGHAMALQPDDSYLSRPALESVEAIRLYAESLDRYGKSPFIYPVYGLGGLPEGFSRLCAIHGGTFILNKGVDEILLNPDGTAAGVRSGAGAAAEVALAPIIIGDPSYFPAAMVKKTGRVIRTICILDHPVAGIEVPDSAQIIIPQSQAGRKNDIYVSVVGHSHQVAAKGKFIAIVATTVETAKPADEVKVGLELLGKMITRFDNIVDTYAPADDGVRSRVFVSSSYDASSHFESTTNEVLAMYKAITGENLDMSAMTTEVNTAE
jgi:Rab GDP dissociation inhibitor